jgi:hypothetical protein
MIAAVDAFPVEDELQEQFRDLLSLAVVGDHLRRVLTDDADGELSAWLAEASSMWRAWADLVAAELAASGIAPDGRVRSLARDIPLNWVPAGWIDAARARRLVADRLATVGEWARYRRSQNEGARARVLDVVCSGFEAQLRALSSGGA